MLGANGWWVLRRHLLPNAAPPLIALLTIESGEVIVYESVLSYLGLGVQPPTASWGAMLKNGMSYLHSAPMLLIAPGVITALTVALFFAWGEDLERRLGR
jgi:ABC-type dipeptide/oligopeptide/nickel transport system permease subunit